MLPERCVTLPHADYVSFEDVPVYLHWGVIIPTWNFELSMLVAALLDKGLVNYGIILVACLIACYGGELVHLLCIYRALAS